MRKLTTRTAALLMALLMALSIFGGGAVTAMAAGDAPPDGSVAAADESAQADTAAEDGSSSGGDFGTEDGASSMPQEDGGDPSSLAPEGSSATGIDAGAEEDPDFEAAGFSLEALLELAREDGSKAAALLRGVADAATYNAGLKAVLDLYYGEELHGLLEAFTAAIDGRADEALARYATAAAERNAERPAFVPGEVLVVFNPEVSEAAAGQVVEENAAVTAGELLPDEPEVALVAEIALDVTVEEAVAQFEAAPEVEFAQPNYLYYAEDAPVVNDTDAGLQWYHSYINLGEAWALLDNLSGLSPASVAMLDTPARLNHPDLAGNLLLQHARNFSNNGTTTYPREVDGIGFDEPDPWAIKAGYSEDGLYCINDPGDHGTHVAGIVAGVANNGIGGVGVGSGSANQAARVMPINVFLYDPGAATGAPYPSASSGVIEAAINYAVRNGARVINLSLGSAWKNDEYLQRGINSAYAAGVTVVAAAGNNNTQWTTGNTGRYQPSDCDNTISVINLKEPAGQPGQYAQNGENVRSPSSNYGHKDIAAPGASIYSTTADGAWGHKSGTSMAAPVVSGVAAMLYHVAPSLTPDEVLELLQTTATDVYTEGYDEQTAFGCVNAGAALWALLNRIGDGAIEADADGRNVLRWAAPAEGVNYEIARGTSAGGPFEVIGQTRQKTYTDATTTGGEFYVYRVRPYIVVNGQQQATESILLLAPGAAPASLTAEQQAGGDIALCWEAVAGSAGYRVYRAPEGSTSYTRIATLGQADTAYTDAGTRADEVGKTFQYKVVALSTLPGDDTLFEGQPARLAVQRLAPVPKLLAARPASATSVSLRWLAVPGTTQYLIYRAAGGGSPTLIKTLDAATLGGGETITWADESAKAADVYTYQVASRAARGTVKIDSAKSEALTGTTELKKPVLNPPAVSSPGRITLSWPRVEGATHYEVQGGTNPDKLPILTLNNQTTSFTYTADVANVEHYFRIVAWRVVNGATQYSDGSEIQSVTPTLAGPTSLKATTVQPGKLALSWKKAGGAAGYVIYRSLPGVPGFEEPQPVGITTGAAYTDTDFWPLADYTYTAKSFVYKGSNRTLPKDLGDLSGILTGGGATGTWHLTTPVQNLTVKSMVGDALLVGWERWPETPQNEGLTYRLERSESPDFEDFVVLYGNEDGEDDTAYLDEVPAHTTWYYYRVIATHPHGYASEPGPLADGAVPLKMGGALTIESGGYNSLHIGWQKAQGATGYTVHRATSPAGPFTLAGVVDGGENTRFTDTGLTAGTGYYYRVYCHVGKEEDGLHPLLRSLNYAQNPELDGVQQPGVPVPAGPAATLEATGYNSLKLGWNLVEGASGYTIYQVPATGEVAEADLVRLRDAGSKTTSYTFAGLTSAEAARYVVRAWRTVGKVKVYSTNLVPTSAEQPVFLDQVQGFGAEATENLHEVRLIWDALPGAAGYTLWHQSADGDDAPVKLATINSGATCEYLHRAAPRGGRTYTIVPQCKVGSKKYDGAPAAADCTVTDWNGDGIVDITGFEGANPGTPAAHQVALRWQPVPGANGYRITRASKDDPGAKPLVITIGKQATATHTDKNVPAGRWQYTITAYKTISGKQCETQPARYPEVVMASPLAEVKDFEVSVPASAAYEYYTAQLRWRYVEGAAGYNIYRADCAPGATPADSDFKLVRKHAAAYDKKTELVSWMDSAVLTGTVQYKIAPILGAARLEGPFTVQTGGDGTPSTFTPRTPACPALLAQAPVVNTGLGAVMVRWDYAPELAARAGEAQGFVVRLTHEGGAVKPITKYATRATDRQLAFTGLVPGEYTVELGVYRTFRGQKRIAWSEGVLTGHAAEHYAAPAGFTAESTALYTVKLSWQKVITTTDPAHAATPSGYAIYRKLPGADGFTLLKTVNNKTVTYNDTAVPAHEGEAAEYYVAAYRTNTKQLGAPSAVDTAEVQSLPAVALAAPVSAGPHKATFTWPRTVNASGYYLQRAAGPAGPWLTEATLGATSKAEMVTTLTGLPEGEWFYRVMPYRTVSGKKLEGKQPTPTAGTTTGLAAIAPADITANPSAPFTLKLGWNRVTGATAYDVYRTDYAADGTATATLRVATVKNANRTAQAVTLTNQPKGSASYTIAPVHTARGRTFHGAVTVVPMGGKAVTGLAAPAVTRAPELSGVLGIKLSWGRVSGASGYHLYLGSGDGAELVATISGGTKTSAVIAAPDDATGPLHYTVVAYKKVGAVYLEGDIAAYEAVAAPNWEDALGLAAVSIEASAPYTTTITTQYGGSGITGFRVWRQMPGEDAVLIKTTNSTRKTSWKTYNLATAPTVTPRYYVTLYRSTSGTLAERVVFDTDTDVSLPATDENPTGAFMVGTLAWPKDEAAASLNGLARTRVANATTFTWQRVEGATGYYLYRASTENGTGVRVATIGQPRLSATQTADPTLPREVAKRLSVPKTGTYYYYVVPYVKAGTVFTAPASQRATDAPGT